MSRMSDLHIQMQESNNEGYVSSKDEGKYHPLDPCHPPDDMIPLCQWNEGVNQLREDLGIANQDVEGFFDRAIEIVEENE